jgi:hypothetical protein
MGPASAYPFHFYLPRRLKPNFVEFQYLLLNIWLNFAKSLIKPGRNRETQTIVNGGSTHRQHHGSQVGSPMWFSDPRSMAAWVPTTTTWLSE